MWACFVLDNGVLVSIAGVGLLCAVWSALGHLLMKSAFSLQLTYNVVILPVGSWCCLVCRASVPASSTIPILHLLGGALPSLPPPSQFVLREHLRHGAYRCASFRNNSLPGFVPTFGLGIATSTSIVAGYIGLFGAGAASWCNRRSWFCCNGFAWYGALRRGRRWLRLFFSDWCLRQVRLWISAFRAAFLPSGRAFWCKRASADSTTEHYM